MENDEEKNEKLNNVVNGDVSQDSFFDTSLDNVDLSNLDNIDLSKIKITPDEVKKVVEEDINLSLPKLKPKYIQSQPVNKEPVAKLSKKEVEMKKVFESMGAGDDDSSKEDPLKQLTNSWGSLEDSSEYKLQLHRLEPQMLKGMKIAGYLETFYLPITIPDIIEKVGRIHGGGRYQLKIVDGQGRYVKMKSFEISGPPKIADTSKEDSATPVSSPLPSQTLNNPFTKKKEEEEDDSDLDPVGVDDSDEDDYSQFFKSRSPLKPRNPHHFGGGGYPGFNSNPFQGNFGGFRRDSEDLESKLESKIDSKISSLDSKISGLVNQITSKKDNNSLLSPELLQAAMPLIGTFLESKRGKDDMLAQQFSEMNNRMISLFQSVQDMTRNNEKSKEDLLEKERSERERARKEWQDTQEKQESRFRELMQTMQTSLEKRFSEEATAQRSIRDEYEKQREDARRRQEEFFEKMRQKEEESKLKIEEIREQARKMEIEKERENRRAEIELIEKMRAIELEKLNYQQEHVRKSYSDSIGTKEYEYKMQLALGNLNKERDSQLQDLKAQMEIEKLKNDAKLELARIKQESEDKKNSDDPFDTIMADYLRRRLQIMMMRDLEGVEAETDDSPMTAGKVFNNVLNKGSEALGNIFQQILNNGMSAESRERPGKVVEPRVTPKPKTNPSEPSKTENTSVPPTTSKPVEPEVEMDENDEEDDGGDVGLDLGQLGPELAIEIEKIAKYFAYLKEAIEQNVEPKEAADIGKQQLLPQIAQYLGTIEDSRIVIQELQGLLDPTLSEFFLKETSTVWLDKLLVHFKEQ